jgi:hypothetical protein
MKKILAALVILVSCKKQEIVNPPLPANNISADTLIVVEEGSNLSIPDVKVHWSVCTTSRYDPVLGTICTGSQQYDAVTSSQGMLVKNDFPANFSLEKAGYWKHSVWDTWYVPEDGETNRLDSSSSPRQKISKMYSMAWMNINLKNVNDYPANSLVTVTTSAQTVKGLKETAKKNFGSGVDTTILVPVFGNHPVQVSIAVYGTGVVATTQIFVPKGRVVPVQLTY